MSASENAARKRPSSSPIVMAMADAPVLPLCAPHCAKTAVLRAFRRHAFAGWAINVDERLASRQGLRSRKFLLPRRGASCKRGPKQGEGRSERNAHCAGDVDKDAISENLGMGVVRRLGTEDRGIAAAPGRDGGRMRSRVLKTRSYVAFPKRKRLIGGEFVFVPATTRFART